MHLNTVKTGIMETMDWKKYESICIKISQKGFSWMPRSRERLDGVKPKTTGRTTEIRRYPDKGNLQREKTKRTETS